MLKSAQELAPIAGLVPKEAKLRKKWTIEFYVKANSNWDCEWDKEVGRRNSLPGRVEAENCVSSVHLPFSCSSHLLFPAIGRR